MTLTPSDAQNLSDYILRYALERLEEITCDQTSTILRLIGLIIPGSFKGTTRHEPKELVSTFDKVSALTAQEFQGLIATASVALTLLERLERGHKALNKMIVEDTQVVNRNGDDSVSVGYF